MPVPSRGPGRSISAKSPKAGKSPRPKGGGKSAVMVKPRGISKTIRASGTRISLINRGV